MQVDEIRQKLSKVNYIAEAPLAYALALFSELKRPILLEGEAGVGKTEVARALSDIFACELIRLQCYEGLDVNSAVYEWNYQHQLLTIASANKNHKAPDIFSEKYLLSRPLLQAIRQDKRPVLLIDEIDRSDEEFEAYLLELLADFQISVPEFGTINAQTIPYVILTSNGTRGLSDALRRRCLYYYLEYPDFDKELRILNTRLPDINKQLARQVVAFVQELRSLELRKNPGIAETLDWACALLRLDVSNIDEDINKLINSMVCLIKTKEDRDSLSKTEIEHILAKAI